MEQNDTIPDQSFFFKPTNTTNNSDDQQSFVDSQKSFTEKLKDSQSKNIKDRMLNFIRDVQANKISDDKISQKVRTEIKEIEIDFQNSWQEEENIKKENGEAVEAIITKALYNKLMSLYPQNLDKRLEVSFKIFEFINLSHFEISEDNIQHQNFEKAIQYIQRIDQVKTPREKLLSICNCCKLLSNMVQQKNQKQPIGADQFLPILIYTVLKSKPVQPVSNLEFIRDYRSEIRLKGIEEYYFTSYESSLEFIDDLDQTKIKINLNEYKKLYSEQQAKYQDELEEIEQKKSFKVQLQETQEVLYKMKAKIFELNDTYDLKPLRFANTPFAQIQLGQLQEFFNEYHLLCKHYIDTQEKCQMISHQIDSMTKNQPKRESKFFGIF